MSSETGDPRPARLSTMATRPSEPEHLPCPRCDSNNTKFCYYNNYNLSQPRHFCKSCRRYWTRGGTLRNIPVGGGSRKPSSASPSSSCNKRPRTTSATTPTASSSSDHHDPPQLHANPVPQMDSGSGHLTGHLMGFEVNLNEAVPEASDFSSLLTTHQSFLPFSGGFGPGLQGLGFGLGEMDWPMEPVGQGTNGSAGGTSSSSSSVGCNNTWQMGGGGVEGGGLAEGDCFGWPELAISMPGKGLKWK